MSSKAQGGVGVLAAALLGALVASQIFGRRAKADCSERTWRVELVSVTASDGSSAHQLYWPTAGSLSAYAQFAQIAFQTSSTEDIQRVRAGQ